MGDLSLIVLTTNSKDGALQALDVAKKLDHDGWIELMDYALFSKDAKGNVTAREMDDEFAERAAAATAAVGGAVVGAVVGGPAGAAAGVAAGALVGAGSMRLTEKLFQESLPRGISAEPRSQHLSASCDCAGPLRRPARRRTPETGSDRSQATTAG